jgi:hypothetical protein
MCICRLENVSVIRPGKAQFEVVLRSTVKVHGRCLFIMTSEECETWQGY